MPRTYRSTPRRSPLLLRGGVPTGTSTHYRSRCAPDNCSRGDAPRAPDHRLPQVFATSAPGVRLKISQAAVLDFAASGRDENPPCRRAVRRGTSQPTGFDLHDGQHECGRIGPARIWSRRRLRRGQGRRWAVRRSSRVATTPRSTADRCRTCARIANTRRSRSTMTGFLESHPSASGQAAALSGPWASFRLETGGPILAASALQRGGVSRGGGGVAAERHGRRWWQNSGRSWRPERQKSSRFCFAAGQRGTSSKFGGAIAVSEVENLFVRADFSNPTPRCAIRKIRMRKQVSNSFLTTASRGTTMNTKLALSAIVAALMLTACAKQEAAAPEAAPAAPAAEAPAAAPDAAATPPAEGAAPAGDAAAAPPADAAPPRPKRRSSKYQAADAILLRA